MFYSTRIRLAMRLEGSAQCRGCVPMAMKLKIVWAKINANYFPGNFSLFSFIRKKLLETFSPLVIFRFFRLFAGEKNIRVLFLH